MQKLNLVKVAEFAENWKDTIPAMQAAVYTMCGGGFIGHFAAEQPADFYIDDRVGKLPFKRDEIYQAVSCLRAIAEANGLDTHNLKYRGFHNCGIF